MWNSLQNYQMIETLQINRNTLKITYHCEWALWNEQIKLER